MDTVNTITGSIQIGWSEENGISRTLWEFLFDAGKADSARFCYFGESGTLYNEYSIGKVRTKPMIGNGAKACVFKGK